MLVPLDTVNLTSLMGLTLSVRIAGIRLLHVVHCIPVLCHRVLPPVPFRVLLRLIEGHGESLSPPSWPYRSKTSGFSFALICMLGNSQTCEQDSHFVCRFITARIADDTLAGLQHSAV